MALLEFRSHVVQEISDLGSNFVNFVQANSGSHVNISSAMRVAAVYACVNAIINDIGGLPLHIHKKLPTGGTKKITTGALYERLKFSPNNEMRPLIWKRSRFLHTLLSGNSYCYIESTLKERVSNLWLLEPEEVKVIRTKHGAGGGRGRIQYEVSDGYGSKKTYQPKQILHLKGFSWNGLTGESIITNYAREQIGIGLELDQFEANFFKNGLNPGGIFTHPNSFPKETKSSFISAIKKRFGGNRNSRLPMVLEDGMTFTPYDVRMVDQEFLGLLKLNKVDICGIFNVPPSRISISDSNTNYNNSEQETRRYYENGLKPLATQDEEELNFKLLTQTERSAGYFIKYNFDAFLRSDSKTRAEIHEKYWRMGVPINTLLELEDRNPVEGGDAGRVQLNTASLETIDEVQKAPAPAPAAPAEPVKEEKRSRKNITKRKRLKEIFKPQIKAAAQALLDYEVKGLVPQLAKLKTERGSSDSFSSIVEKFYKDFESHASNKMASIFLKYSEEINKAMCSDIGLESNEMTASTRKKINEYIEKFALDYKSSSIGQLKAEFKKGLDEVFQRLDEWQAGRIEESPTRPEKVADRHVNSLDGRVARSVIFGAGLLLVWRASGGACDLCQQLDGMVVGAGEMFVNSGDTLSAGSASVTPRGSVRYPQLHANCNCSVSWV